jgi:carbon-monoxide dehydrogenase medium subunit
VKPAAFSHFAPTRLADALALLASHADTAKILAGGQSLVPALNFRLGHFPVLIDLNRIEALAYIRVDGSVLRIGAMTRQRDIETSPLVAEHAPLLAEATLMVSHLPIRSRGTIGGSLAHADPSSEYPAVMLTLDAVMVMQSQAGVRRVAAADFFHGFFETAIGSAEILVEIEIPVARSGQRFAFDEVSRRRGDFAIVGIAAALTMQQQRIVAARLTGCGVGAGPVRLQQAEQLLEVRDATTSLIHEAAVTAAAEVEPQSDLHAGAEYRRKLVNTLVKRVVARAAFEGRSVAA